MFTKFHFYTKLSIIATSLLEMFKLFEYLYFNTSKEINC